MDLAEKYDCMTYIDDAHASGVLGESAGVRWTTSAHGRVDFTIGTLSKAIGVMGGYVAGKQVLIDCSSTGVGPFCSAPPIRRRWWGPS